MARFSAEDWSSNPEPLARIMAPVGLFGGIQQDLLAVTLVHISFVGGPNAEKLKGEGYLYQFNLNYMFNTWSGLFIP